MKIFLSFICVLFILFYPLKRSGYEPEKTHPMINRYAAELSDFDAYVKAKLGIAKGIAEFFNEYKVVQWFEEGGKKEDWPEFRG
jgi:hypothetical protein